MHKIYFIIVFFFIATISNQALADCTNPAKAEGFIIYNKDHKVAQFCNGTDWIGMAGGTTSIMTGDTMVDGWPDAIVCNASSTDYVFHFIAVDASKAYYRYIWNTSGTRTIEYDASDGSYLGTAGDAFSNDCTTNSWSIDNLYTNDRAFNLVGGGSGSGPGSDTLAGLSCTDGQMVLYDTTTTAWICADVSASGAADNLGNHTATQNLDMASYGIDNVESITLDSVVGGAAPVSSSDNGVPSGFIGAFDLAACPTGWSEYTAARGRFPRGIDPTGTNDPDGVRVAGSTQADAFQGHWHNLGTSGNVSGARGTATGSGSYRAQLDPGGSAIDVTQAMVPISDGTNGAPRTANETRPKNFAVLYCRKD